MADKSQFEKHLACTDCEPRFNELVDESLPDGERMPLEAHVAGCESCRAALAEIRRGHAWLRILREDDVLLEPPAGLVERILAATSGDMASLAGGQPSITKPAASPWSSVHLPAVRRSGWYQPRLVLTAAMAFFSITLTLNVAGIRANDLRPKNLRHTATQQYFQANAHVVRYYENLRVVYELESRVRELRKAAETNSPASAPSSPRKKSTGPGSSRQPGPLDPGMAHDHDTLPDADPVVSRNGASAPLTLQSQVTADRMLDQQYASQERSRV